MHARGKNEPRLHMPHRGDQHRHTRHSQLNYAHHLLASVVKLEETHCCCSRNLTYLAGGGDLQTGKIRKIFQPYEAVPTADKSVKFQCTIDSTVEMTDFVVSYGRNSRNTASLENQENCHGAPMGPPIWSLGPIQWSCLYRSQKPPKRWLTPISWPG